MFNFRNTTLAFFAVLFTLNLLFALGIDIPLWCWIVLIAVYLFISVLFSFFIASGYHMKAVCRGNRVEKKIALTFDDGPDPVRTEAILDILKEEKVPATFFIIGRKIEGAESILRRITDEGHVIGGHSWTHSDWLDFFPPRKIRKEMIVTDEKILEITGKKIRLFRPPYGVINPMVKKALATRNYLIIGYSNRLWDTVSRDPKKITERYKRQLKNGDIVLLHDPADITVSVLRELIQYTKGSGYAVVSLQELIQEEPYGKI